MKKISARMWATLILIGLVGQFAWTIENMYFNVFLYNTISTDPGYISAMVGWSAAAATLTTLLMGALSDRAGRRKVFICGGYLLWGASTAAFGFVTVENAAKLFPANAVGAAAMMVVVLDCVMTFFGSTANDAAFNAYITDNISEDNRGKTEGVLAVLPLPEAAGVLAPPPQAVRERAVARARARARAFFMIRFLLVIVVIWNVEANLRDQTGYLSLSRATSHRPGQNSVFPYRTST